MKKLKLIFTVFVLLSFQVFAQDATISIPDITAAANTEVLVPLTITDINNVGSASLRVTYDTDVLTYIGIENSAFSGMVYNDLGGEVRTSWFSLSAVNLSGKVYDIRFEYKGGTCDIAFSLVQMTDNLSNLLDIAFTDGSIGPVGETLSLTSPNGGEVWEVGTVQNITWSSTGPANIMIEYSTDNGTGWNTVIASTPNTGSYAWTIPDTPTDQALVFIMDAANGSLFDESDAVFSIVSPPAPPVVGNIPDQTINEGESFSQINLDNYVTDEDNDVSEITWEATGQTDLSVSIVNRVATISVPNAEWNGSETITFTATDPDDLSDNNSATFTVNPVNDPPVVSGIPDQTINEGESFATINLDDYVSDPDNQPSEMTWEATGQAELTVTINNRVATIGVPSDTWNGSETITFTATDPGDLSDSDAATFTVNSVNNPPVVSGIPDQTINEGESFATVNLDDYVTDPDNSPDQMTWAASGQSELTVTITNRVATITPPNGVWTGNETITFTATDPGSLSDSDDATFTVIPVVGTEEEINEIPDDYVLDQNYPNPFNPSTSISYGLKVNSEVTLRVYNMVGQEMVTLVDQTKNAGTYIVNFDASNLSTGIYFYTITAIGVDGSKFVNTRKMILMK